ncbi:uncharacterized protein LOC143511982 isoform X5 [Brachyhypopomus gauderio]|uniref:uncharacterized protein LOC143511982 isoform X5 n=1 Tax=Brachyhypopomus gauderio TaxID=698409 RepID=UPI0040412B98
MEPQLLPLNALCTHRVSGTSHLDTSSPVPPVSAQTWPRLSSQARSSGFYYQFSSDLTLTNELPRFSSQEQEENERKITGANEVQRGRRHAPPVKRDETRHADDKSAHHSASTSVKSFHIHQDVKSYYILGELPFQGAVGPGWGPTGGPGVSAGSHGS